MAEEDNKKALEILKRELKIKLVEQNSIKESEIQALVLCQAFLHARLINVHQILILHQIVGNIQNSTNLSLKLP